MAPSGCALKSPSFTGSSSSPSERNVEACSGICSGSHIPPGFSNDAAVGFTGVGSGLALSGVVGVAGGPGGGGIGSQAANNNANATSDEEACFMATPPYHDRDKAALV